MRALRAPFLAGSIVPIIIASSFALTKRTFFIPHFLITLAGVSGLHLGANLLNDYYDSRGSDPINLRLTPFSGGSRVIQNGEMDPKAVLWMALSFFALALVAGILLSYLGRPFVMAIGFAGLFAGWVYSAPPLQLMCRGWGEMVIFFAFGPLITLGTFYVMAGEMNLHAFLLGFPQGFLITGVIWINQFPDTKADREAGKRNLVVRFGPNISRQLYNAMIVMAFVSPILLAIMEEVTLLVVLCFIALPLAFKAMKILWRNYLSHEAIVPAQAMTIQTLVAHGLLMSLGLLLGWLFGV